MSTLSLHDLPAEIIESILVVQPPETVCAIACTSRVLNAVASGVWPTIAKRTLRASAAPNDTAASTRAIASSLTCAWWAANGALVRGVPVHFRRRFLGVRERGAAALVRIRSANSEAALVLGANDDHGPHAPKPALEMDFAFDTSGPFPVDGMVVRILGAPVPSSPPSPPSSPLARSPPAHSWMPQSRMPRSPPRSPTLHGGLGPRLPRASQLRVQGRRDRAAAAILADHDHDDVSATVRVLLNGSVAGTHTVNELCAFRHIDIELPTKMMRCKPRMNTLVVEYVEQRSTAPYWLKEVRMVPKVLPMCEQLPIDNVPLRHVGISSHDANAQNAELGSPKHRRVNTHFSIDRIMGC